MIRIDAHEIEIDKWDYTGQAIDGADYVALNVTSSRARDRKSGAILGFKLNWKYALLRSENVYLNVEAHQGFELANLSILDLEMMKKIVWESFWKFKEAYADKIKKDHNMDRTIMCTITEEMILEILNFLKSKP